MLKTLKIEDLREKCQIKVRNCIRAYSEKYPRLGENKDVCLLRINWIALIQGEIEKCQILFLAVLELSKPCWKKGDLYEKEELQRAKCTKRILSKCENVCRTYDAIQYALFNTFFLNKIKPIKKTGDKILGMEDGLGWNSESIRIIRIWTKKSIGISLDKMLDDNTYYIFEGIDYHPSLKNKITNYLKDVPFFTATIYMQKFARQILLESSLSGDDFLFNRKFLLSEEY